jgi:quercetin dioxygenase-like cupin family protein
MQTVFTPGSGGEVAQLGIAQMRLLLAAEQTNGSISAGEFRGSAGPWTVPHVHHDLDELFYVVDGAFTFTCGDQSHAAEAGALVMVPRGTRHVFSATEDGTVLVLWTPGGLEQMFLQLGRLPADSITNPQIRVEISRHYDSVPA